MKKFVATCMGALMLAACCLGGCGGKEGPNNDDDKNKEEDPVQNPTTETVDDAIQTDRASLDFLFNNLYNNKALVDEANGFTTSADVTGGRFFVNGHYQNTISEVGSRQDVKVELFNGTNIRAVNVSAGMAFTIPSAEVKVDYELAKYRTQYQYEDAILTFSAESRNPYTSLPNGWYIYINEWAIRHLVNETYLTNQNISRINPLKFEVTPVGANGTSDGTHTYPTVKNGDLTTRPGYEIYRFDLLINDAGEIERPYYHIGIIHEQKDNINAGFFVMKAKQDRSADMDKIINSWVKLTSKGLTRNYFANEAPVEEPHWNAETKAYYNQLMTQDDKSWGVFSYSMPGQEASLVPGNTNYESFLYRSRRIQEVIEEEVWGGKKFDIYMTYTHLGSGAISNPNRTPHYFPTAMAKELAGGNGDGTRPTIEFTFQYTTNNNLVDQEISPMFDIMRGKYDAYFARLAKDIKEYGKPMLFRLNNEMNTDWTSYSGIMNLLDPDIFNMTWRRLYDIFIENGVDNAIWVWNPIADSCPYSGWGEDLCYFPGRQYVQFLGGTSYEANNYEAEKADEKLVSFRDHYNALYEKNKVYFEKWGMVLGEFAVGSGGDASGEIARNAAAQAKWVRGMFEELYADEPAPYAQQIKGLIWFNCNDYGGNGAIGVTNLYRFTDGHLPDNPKEQNVYGKLKETWKAFADGFAAAKAKGKA